MKLDHHIRDPFMELIWRLQWIMTEDKTESRSVVIWACSRSPLRNWRCNLGTQNTPGPACITWDGHASIFNMLGCKSVSMCNQYQTKTLFGVSSDTILIQLVVYCMNQQIQTCARACLSYRDKTHVQWRLGRILLDMYIDTSLRRGRRDFLSNCFIMWNLWKVKQGCM